MTAEVATEVEKLTDNRVGVETGSMLRVLETHVRQHLEALADLRVSLV